MAIARVVARRPPGRKAQILAAAREQFHRRGYHQVSMADVAAGVGITAPALYRHFRSKPELLRQTVAADLAALNAAVRAGSGGPEALCAALSASAMDNRALATLLQRDVRLLPAVQRAELRAQLRACVGEMARVLLAARPELSSADAELICWSTLAAYGSLSYHTFVPPRRRFERLLQELGGALFAAGPGGAPELPVRCELASPASESRREELLATAVRMFHQRGFDNVSTEQLGSAVGIAGPSLYKHFDTKAELLNAALVRSRERLWHEVSRAFAGAADPVGALAAGLVAYIDFARRNSDYLGVMLSETERLAPSDRRAAVEFRRDFLRNWVGLLQQVRPEYDQAEARIRVHAMFALVNDGVRNRPACTRPDLGGCLLTLSRAALGVTEA